MYSPSLNHPPGNETFSYRIANVLDQVGDAEIDAIRPRIGSLITSRQYRGRLTPLEKERLFSITASAVLILSAVGTLVAGVSLFIPPLCFVAIPLGIASIALLVYSLTRGPDLNTTKGRNEIMDKLVFESFNQIANDYSADHVIGYALLDKLIPCASSPETRDHVYAQFEKLAMEWNRLKNWHNEKHAQVDSTWNRETLPMRSWYQNNKVLINEQRCLIRQQENRLRRRVFNRELHTHQPAYGLRTAKAAISVINVWNELELNREEKAANREYLTQITPWDVWRRQELNSLRTVYQNVSQDIDNEFFFVKNRTKVNPVLTHLTRK